MTEWPSWFPWPQESFDSVAVFLNSNFSTALLGSLAGALGGAWGAQRIAEKSKTRELLLREIRQANAASIVLNSIANTHLGMKKQHIKKLRDDFEAERESFLTFASARKAGTVPPQQLYQFKADMQTLNPPYTPVEQLKALIFDELSVSGGELFITPLLLSSLQSLAESLEVRNGLITEWKQAQLDQATFATNYFGVKQGSVADERYRGAVSAIYEMNDDVISFSMMLADSLQAYAEKRRDIYLKSFNGPKLRVNKFDYSEAKEYLPEANDDLKRFKQMLTMAQRDADRPMRWYKRLWKRLR